MSKQYISLLFILFRVCLAHYGHDDDGMDLFINTGSNIYNSNEDGSLLPYGEALVNAECSYDDKSAPCGKPLSKFYNPRFQGSACVRQGCCWNDEKRQCYQRVYNVLKSSPTMEWCNKNGNLYYNNICYFIPDKDSSTYAQAQQSCDDTHQGAELAQITSESLQGALMAFSRLSMSGVMKVYRVAGSYDTVTDKVSWDGGNTYIASNLIMRWRSGDPNTFPSNVYLFLAVFGDEANNDNGVYNAGDPFTASTLCQIR